MRVFADEVEVRRPPRREHRIHIFRGAYDIMLPADCRRIVAHVEIGEQPDPEVGILIAERSPAVVNVVSKPPSVSNTERRIES